MNLAYKMKLLSDRCMCECEKCDIALTLDENGVREIDKTISEVSKRVQIPGKPAKYNSEMIRQFGAFLGECLRAECGGEWEETDKGYAVVVEADDKAMHAFPMNRVSNNFYNGDGDSVLGWYKVICAMAKHADKLAEMVGAK